MRTKLNSKMKYKCTKQCNYNDQPQTLPIKTNEQPSPSSFAFVPPGVP